MNLPNAITVGRIIAAPLIALMMVPAVWQLRFGAWVLYLAAAITDYFDGKLARSRNLVTDLGRLLDPLADKLLLLCTLLPMYWLTGWSALLSPLPPDGGWAFAPAVGPVLTGANADRLAYPFVTPVGLVGLPLWVIAVVLGRELIMTVFRHLAAHRGVIISAIGPAKWKTGFQATWVGAAIFWYFAALFAGERRWTSGAWSAMAHLSGVVGTVSMAGAVVLTLYSLWLYVKRYGYVLVPGKVRGT